MQIILFITSSKNGKGDCNENYFVQHVETSDANERFHPLYIQRNKLRYDKLI